MDEERLRWITKPKTLDGWECRVTFNKTPEGVLAHLWAAGTCDRRRGYLWTHEEVCPVGGSRYSLHDLLTHLSMAVEQDRPTSNQELTRSLCGEAWEQPELPW